MFNNIIIVQVTTILDVFNWLHHFLICCCYLLMVAICIKIYCKFITCNFVFYSLLILNKYTNEYWNKS